VAVSEATAALELNYESRAFSSWGRAKTSAFCSCVGRPGEPPVEPERDVDEADEDGHLDQWADDAGERLA
jgi:hypothetical protein